jgi:AraC-like DNA-binding protein
MDNIDLQEDAMKTKREGFYGQKLIRIPSGIQSQISKDPLSRPLYLTDIGYYPKVNNHRVVRNTPLELHVLIYCADGEGWCEVEGARHTIRKNCYFLLPAKQAHAYGNSAKTYWEIYWVHFGGDQSGQFCERLCNGKYGEGIRLIKRKEMLQLFHHMINSLEAGVSAEGCTYANAQLWHLLGDMAYHRRFANDKDKTLIDQAITMMQERVEEQMSLAQLSGELNLSTAYFCRLFKKRTEQTPMDFFTRLKMQRACRYLDFTDMTVQDVAQMLGYDDPYYFSRAFKRVMNVSPSHYRQSNQH